MTSALTIDVYAPSEQSEGTRAQLLRWLKGVGETVRHNEPLIEVETDKVTVEVPAPAAGVLREILKQEHESIDPGEVLARIEVAEALADQRVEAVERPATVASDVVPDTGALSPEHPAMGSDSARRAKLRSEGRASPAVRRLLQRHHLRAETVRGSGVDGSITVDDVLIEVADRVVKTTGTTGTISPVAERPVIGRLVPHSATRRRIAEHMVRSLLHTAPHVTTVFEADFSAVLAHRARHRDDFQRRGVSLTLTAYILAACVDAIGAVPEVNARWHEDALELFDAIDIGIGTAIKGRGLVVPVLRDVHRLDLFGIASELARLVSAAREERLTPQEVGGGTFTISNHGVSGSLVAAPIIIHQPQVAILGVGKVENRAVVIEAGSEERIVVKPRAYITLTVDHRAMDGDRANQFLSVLVHRLERWPLD